MRAVPSLALSGNNRIIYANTAIGISGITTHHFSASSVFSSLSVSSGLTAGGVSALGRNNDTSAKLTLSAEL